VINFFLQALFQSAQHLYEKREGSGSDPIPLTNGSRSGGPKTCGSGSPTLCRIPDTQNCAEYLKVTSLSWDNPFTIYVQEIIHLDSEGAELGEKTIYLSLHNDYSTLFEALRIDTGYVALITNPHTARHAHSLISPSKNKTGRFFG
jgi:hypothetical protein